MQSYRFSPKGRKEGDSYYDKYRKRTQLLKRENSKEKSVEQTTISSINKSVHANRTLTNRDRTPMNGDHVSANAAINPTISKSISSKSTSSSSSSSYISVEKPKSRFSNVLNSGVAVRSRIGHITDVRQRTPTDDDETVPVLGKFGCKTTGGKTGKDLSKVCIDVKAEHTPGMFPNSGSGSKGGANPRRSKFRAGQHLLRSRVKAPYQCNAQQRNSSKGKGRRVSKGAKGKRASTAPSAEDSKDSFLFYPHDEHHHRHHGAHHGEHGHHEHVHHDRHLSPHGHHKNANHHHSGQHGHSSGQHGHGHHAHGHHHGHHHEHPNGELHGSDRRHGLHSSLFKHGLQHSKHCTHHSTDYEYDHRYDEDALAATKRPPVYVPRETMNKWKRRAELLHSFPSPVKGYREMLTDEDRSMLFRKARVRNRFSHYFEPANLKRLRAKELIVKERARKDAIERERLEAERKARESVVKEKQASSQEDNESSDDILGNIEVRNQQSDSTQPVSAQPGSGSQVPPTPSDPQKPSASQLPSSVNPVSSNPLSQMTSRNRVSQAQSSNPGLQTPASNVDGQSVPLSPRPSVGGPPELRGGSPQRRLNKTGSALKVRVVSSKSELRESPLHWKSPPKTKSRSFPRIEVDPIAKVLAGKGANSDTASDTDGVRSILGNAVEQLDLYLKEIDHGHDESTSCGDISVRHCQPSANTGGQPLTNMGDQSLLNKVKDGDESSSLVNDDISRREEVYDITKEASGPYSFHYAAQRDNFAEKDFHENVAGNDDRNCDGHSTHHVNPHHAKGSVSPQGLFEAKGSIAPKLRGGVSSPERCLVSAERRLHDGCDSPEPRLLGGAQRSLSGSGSKSLYIGNSKNSKLGSGISSRPTVTGSGGLKNQKKSGTKFGNHMRPPDSGKAVGTTKSSPTVTTKSKQQREADKGMGKRGVPLLQTGEDDFLMDDPHAQYQEREQRYQGTYDPQYQAGYGPEKADIILDEDPETEKALPYRNFFSPDGGVIYVSKKNPEVAYGDFSPDAIKQARKYRENVRLRGGSPDSFSGLLQGVGRNQARKSDPTSDIPDQVKTNGINIGLIEADVPRDMMYSRGFEVVFAHYLTRSPKLRDFLAKNISQVKTAGMRFDALDLAPTMIRWKSDASLSMTDLAQLLLFCISQRKDTLLSSEHLAGEFIFDIMIEFRDARMLQNENDDSSQKVGYAFLEVDMSHMSEKERRSARHQHRFKSVFRVDHLLTMCNEIFLTLRKYMKMRGNELRVWRKRVETMLKSAAGETLLREPDPESELVGTEASENQTSGDAAHANPSSASGTTGNSGKQQGNTGNQVQLRVGGAGNSDNAMLDGSAGNVGNQLEGSSTRNRKYTATFRASDRSPSRADTSNAQSKDSFQQEVLQDAKREGNSRPDAKHGIGQQYDRNNTAHNYHPPQGTYMGGQYPHQGMAHQHGMVQQHGMGQNSPGVSPPGSHTKIWRSENNMVVIASGYTNPNTNHGRHPHIFAPHNAQECECILSDKDRRQMQVEAQELKKKHLQEQLDQRIANGEMPPGTQLHFTGAKKVKKNKLLEDKLVLGHRTTVAGHTPPHWYMPTRFKPLLSAKEVDFDEVNRIIKDTPAAGVSTGVSANSAGGPTQVQMGNLLGLKGTSNSSKNMGNNMQTHESMGNSNKNGQNQSFGGRVDECFLDHIMKRKNKGLCAPPWPTYNAYAKYIMGEEMEKEFGQTLVWDF